MSNVDLSSNVPHPSDESPFSYSTEGVASFGKKDQEVAEGGVSSEDEEPYSSRTSRSISSCSSEDELCERDREVGKTTATKKGGEESSKVEVGVIEEDEDYTYEPPPYIPGEFEGPEKTMELRFSSSEGSHPEGLRSLSRSQLERICAKARCGILSHISNNHVDAYVLSESSMFVYRDKLMMKTCGTTTLLLALATIVSHASELGMQLQWFEYSRKNLLFPDAQMAPHRSYHDEVSFLSKHPALQSSDGGGSVIEAGGHVLGPITGDHWFVYVAERKPLSVRRGAHATTSSLGGDVNHGAPQAPLRGLNLHGPVLNIMMFGMDQAVAKSFYQDSYAHLGLTEQELGAHMSKATGISDLCPSDHFDQHSFEPCGYSLNAILHDSYSTVHVTPEPDCSYVSFETNSCLGTGAGGTPSGERSSHSRGNARAGGSGSPCDALIRNVVNVFRPQRFLLTYWADSAMNDASSAASRGGIASGSLGKDWDTGSTNAGMVGARTDNSPTSSTSIYLPAWDKEKRGQEQEQGQGQGQGSSPPRGMCVYARDQSSSTHLNDRTTVHTAHYTMTTVATAAADGDTSTEEAPPGQRMPSTLAQAVRPRAGTISN